MWLADSSDNKRVKYRQEITQNILNEVGVEQYVLEMEGNLFQERFLHSVHFGDWLSYWCAIFHKTDPTPVKKIDILKNKLSESI